MRDDLVLAVTTALVVGICAAVIAVVAGLRLRGRVFQGPARDAWELTRRDLSAADQWHVRRATSRRRPVNRGDLAPAQLVYTRYAQFTADRSPFHRRWFRMGMVFLYLALAAQQFVTGATATHLVARIIDFVAGGWWVVLAALFGLWVNGWLARQPTRLKRLRQVIRQRWPNDWA
jgi:VanZ family protein